MAAWDVVTLAQALVRLPTFPGQEQPAIQLLHDVMSDLKYDAVHVDEAGNLIGTIEGGRPGSIVLDGHVDVVAPGDPRRWTHPPFGAEIDGDLLYGRGSTDMKGAVAAMVLAAGRLTDDDRSARRTVHVSCSVAEELVEGLAFDAVCDVTRPDAVVIGEPTGLALAVGQRGRAEIEVEVIGRAGHSAYPETAVNAIDKMVPLLPRFYAAPLPEPHEIVGPALLVATDIASSPLPANSTIPESCRVTFDRRLLPGETPESVLAPLRAAVDAVRHEDPTLKARVELGQGDFVSYSGRRLKGAKFLPGWFMPLESRLVECAEAALRSVEITPRITSYLTCTNGSCSAGMRGVPTIGFGPGDDEQSHRTDESVRLSALHQAVIGYTALARWLSAVDALER